MALDPAREMFAKFAKFAKFAVFPFLGTLFGAPCYQMRIMPSAVQRENTMRIFEDDDAGYLAWVGSHPHGFVVNTFRKPDPRYLMLHRATCHTITGKPARRTVGRPASSSKPAPRCAPSSTSGRARSPAAN
jgi:hypothetical protein